MYKHFFFDVDKTLTRSRSEVEPDMIKVLEELVSKGDVVAVSGAEESQIWKQLTSRFKDSIYILAQNGNYARLPGDEETLWAEELTENMREDIERHIKKVKANFPELFEKVDENDLIQDRGCQIGFSLYGHNAPVEEKEQFDPDLALRKHILLEVPFDSDEVEVKIGGTTTFDYFKKGSTKGANVDRFIKEMDWEHQDCVYVGDGLITGGNDESVIGVCDTVPVKDHKETLVLIKNSFLGEG
ncbi:MAG: HAD-IIB family hydrolase [Candidatus Paceibacterota bacterium]